MRTVYLPFNDTLKRKVAVNPGKLAVVDVQLFNNPWGSSGPGKKLIIRPNGTGDYADLISSGCTSNWQCVDEEISDDDVSFIENSFNDWIIDTYGADNPAGSGTIDSLVVFMRVRNNGSSQQARTALLVDGSEFYGTNQNLDGVTSYTDYSTTYINNPDILAAWTWTELNNIQIGVSLIGPARCTQVWAEVFYTN